MNTNRCFLYIFLFATGLLTASCAEIGETILEPIQPIFVPSANNHAIGGSSEQKLAQTFTINRNGTLTGVFLPAGCSSGSLEVEIHNVDGGEPGTTVLSSEMFEADSIVTEVTVFKLFSLPASTVSAGDSLALVLSNSGGSCGMSSAPIGDSYLGGEGFFDARPNQPGWVPFSNFDSTSHDLAFQVLLEDV